MHLACILCACAVSNLMLASLFCFAHLVSTERLLGSDHLTGIPVLVVANKRDKEVCNKAVHVLVFVLTICYYCLCAQYCALDNFLARSSTFFLKKFIRCFSARAKFEKLHGPKPHSSKARIF